MESDSNVKQKNSFNHLGQLSTTTLGNNRAWHGGYKRFSSRVEPLENSADGYFQVIFKNRSNEIIKMFQSVQESIQYCKLKYRRDGGLKEAEFTVSYHDTIPSYGEMLIEFRNRSSSLGSIYSDKISVENGLLTITGYSAFSRLSSEIKLTGESFNLTLKETVLYFLNLIDKGVTHADRIKIFTINHHKILVDDKILIKNFNVTKKSPLDILKGLATLGGKISYGIDEYLQFYFIDQLLIKEDRWFVDHHTSDLNISTDDSSVVNHVKLYNKDKHSDQLVLFSNYSDDNSVAQYGEKSVDISLDFSIDTIQPDLYAKRFITASPMLQGSIIIHNEEKPVSLGAHTVTSYLCYDKRLILNNCKDLSSLHVTNMVPVKISTGFITGRYAYEFVGSGTLMVDCFCTGASSLILMMSNNKPITVRWQERGLKRCYVVEPMNRVRSIKIITSAIDEGVLFEVDGSFILDSTSYTTNFVESHRGYYEAHEVELTGNSIKTLLKLGNDKNDLIEQVKEFKDNASLIGSLLKEKEK